MKTFSTISIGIACMLFSVASMHAAESLVTAGGSDPAKSKETIDTASWQNISDAGGSFNYFGWDPKGNLIYASSLGGSVYRLKVKP